LTIRTGSVLKVFAKIVVIASGLTIRAETETFTVRADSIGDARSTFCASFVLLGTADSITIAVAIGAKERTLVVFTDSVEITNIAIVGTVNVFFVDVADIIKVTRMNDNVETACIRVSRVIGGQILDGCCAKGEEGV